MTIVGVGHDLVQVARMAKIYARFGERFLRRAFHEREIRDFRALENVGKRMVNEEGASRVLISHKAAEFLAGRWAAKEAVFKVLSAQSKVHWIPFADIVVAKGLSFLLLDLLFLIPRC